MNAKTIAVVVLGIFAVALPSGAQARDEQPVAVNTANLPTHLRERLEEAAQRGQPAVIQFVNRTRMIYQLRAEDVLAKPQSTATADRDVKLADAGKKQDK